MEFIEIETVEDNQQPLVFSDDDEEEKITNKRA